MKSRPDRDRYLLDLAKVNQGTLFNDFSIIGYVFLEALNNDILSPMDVSIERNWFTASAARSIITDLLIKVVTDGLQILIPIWSAESIDSILFEMEETFSVDPVAFTHVDSARVNSSEGEQVVSEELILHLGQSVKHLNCAL